MSVSTHGSTSALAFGEIAGVRHEIVRVVCNEPMPAGLNWDVESGYAAKHRTREMSACIVAGSDPRSPEGDLARKQAGKRGSLPAMKRFLPRTVFVRVPSLVPWSTSTYPSPLRNGMRNGMRNDPRKFPFRDSWRTRF